MNEDREREEDPLSEPWISHWEQQCIQEVENEADLEERIRSEKDFANQKTWQMFQNAATAIAQLYKDRQQGVALWASFQTAAGAVTCMYKESLDIQKKTTELGMQSGYQRRTRDLLAWAKKHRRHIRREDLIAYLADKNPPSRSRSSPRQRLTLDRSSPRLGLPPQEPIAAHAHNPEADMQTFRDALTLASLNGAMSNVSVGYRGHTPGSPPLGSHSRRRNAFTDLNAFICEEFTPHCEARKRTASSTDVIMDSPTHKRSRLMVSSDRVITDIEGMDFSVLQQSSHHFQFHHAEGDTPSLEYWRGCKLMALSAESGRKREVVGESDDVEAKHFKSDEQDRKSDCEVKMQIGMRCSEEFFNVPCKVLARRLLGQTLVCVSDGGQRISGRIVETEAYLGGEDKASHSFQGRRTPRNKPMFMKPGTVYVYLTYGMHFCFNISSEGEGAAVLVRALEPLEGIPQMHRNRAGKRQDGGRSLKTKDLCNGPSKLCQALNITKDFTEMDLATNDRLWIEKGEEIATDCIILSTRIGIGPSAEEWVTKLLRYYVRGIPYVSVRDKKREAEAVNRSQQT